MHVFYYSIKVKLNENLWIEMFAVVLEVGKDMLSIYTHRPFYYVHHTGWIAFCLQNFLMT